MLVIRPAVYMSCGWMEADLLLAVHISGEHTLLPVDCVDGKVAEPSIRPSRGPMEGAHKDNQIQLKIVVCTGIESSIWSDFRTML